MRKKFFQKTLNLFGKTHRIVVANRGARHLKIENKKNPIKILKKGVFFFREKAISMFSRSLQFKRMIKGGRRTSLILVISAFLVLNVFLLSTIGGQLLASTSLQSHGTIETIGVSAYRDSACTTSITGVDWGTIVPGVSITNTFYVRNEGNSKITLSLNTQNWNPINARSYMSLGWNYEGQIISPNQVVQVTFTLSVSQDISGVESFYFNIIIMGAS